MKKTVALFTVMILAPVLATAGAFTNTRALKGLNTAKKKIQGWIGQFHENGFTLEQCAIAARGQKVPAGDILPEITVVKNGYISIVAYQNKGFALLPMD